MQFAELLGSGAFKKVYKGIDTEQGIEIAWGALSTLCLVDCRRCCAVALTVRRTTAVIELDRQVVDVKQLQREIKILSSLDHENILKFYDSWIDEDKMLAVFITEFMAAGTLKQFLMQKRTPPRLRVIKNWARQMLSGLNYLHTREPPVMCVVGL